MLINATILCAQGTMRYSVGTSFMMNQFDFSYSSYLNYKVSFGTQFYDKLGVTLEGGYMNNQKLGNPQYVNMRTVTMGVNLNYRFLKKAVVSPKISISGGFFPYTNLKGKYVGENHSAIDTTESSDFKFKSWGPYFDAQIFLSIKMKHFYLDIGHGISRLGYTVFYQFYNNPPILITKEGFGWCATMKLSYVFGGEKKTETNVSRDFL